MTEDVPSEYVEELIAGYVLGELSSEEAEQLRQILRENPELLAKVYSLQEVLGLIPYALSLEEPPSHLRSKIFDAASVNVDARLKPKQSSWQWVQILGSVVVMIVLSLSLLNLYNYYRHLNSIQVKDVRQRNLITMLCQPNTYLVPLKGIDTTSDASGSLVITPGNSEAMLVIQKLPTLPTGQIYRLWSVINGKKVTWVQFNSDSQGIVLLTFFVSPNFKISSLFITLESWQQSSDTVSSPVVMKMS